MTKVLKCDMCGTPVDEVCTVDLGMVIAHYCSICNENHEAQVEEERSAHENSFYGNPEY